MDANIHTRGLSIGHPRKKKGDLVLAKDLELSCRKGELLALVGPNGCGKSTLLRTLAGFHPPLEGSVLLEGSPIEERTPKERAHLLSIVLTGMDAPTNLTVRDLVSLGRTPYRSAFMPMSKEDHRAVTHALKEANVEWLAEKTLDTLSDGESQKVMIARALAQNTGTMILDEPTAHLDLLNRVEIGRMLRELARQRNVAILMSSHDLESILRLADRVWLMNGDGRIQEGIPEELAMDGSFSEVFSNDKLHFDRNDGSFRSREEAKGTLVLEGEGIRYFWTQRALERIGYRIRKKSTEEESADVTVNESGWKHRGQDHASLESLIQSSKL